MKAPQRLHDAGQRLRLDHGPRLPRRDDCLARIAEKSATLRKAG